MNVDRLKLLSSISAPSGYEDRLIHLMRQEMLNNTAEVSIDRLGNVIARLAGTTPGSSAPLMLFAHMDELGFVIRKIEDNGYLRLERLGGIPERTAACRPVMVLGAREPIMGVTGHKSHHYTKPDEKYSVIRVQDLYVDIGAPSKQAVAELGISVGDPVTYAPFFHVHNDLVFGKSMDNRAGCEVLLSVMENLARLPHDRDVYIVATTQEEFSLRGVIPTYARIQPEIAVAIDVVVACDTPDLEGVSDTRLGAGPAVSRYSFHGRGTLGGLIPNPRLVTAILQAAERLEIPCQKNVSMGLLTDTSFFQLEGEGVYCLDVGIPTRYTHAPIEVVSIKDLDLLIKLLTGFFQ
jgi:putative aminopeptidase